MELDYAALQGRRPQFIFSSKHSSNGNNPVSLPPLPNTLFERYHPQNGLLSVASDRVKIEQLVNDLKPYMTVVNYNLIGFKAASKAERKKLKKKKWGRYVYATNDGKYLVFVYLFVSRLE